MTAFAIDDRSAAEVRRLRESHGPRPRGYSLAGMAGIARLSDRQTWAKYENGSRVIDRLRWEWCLLMLGEHPTMRLTKSAA